MHERPRTIQGDVGDQLIAAAIVGDQGVDLFVVIRASEKIIIARMLERVAIATGNETATPLGRRKFAAAKCVGVGHGGKRGAFAVATFSDNPHQRSTTDDQCCNGNIQCTEIHTISRRQPRTWTNQ